MVRSFIFVLIASTGWCKSPKPNEPGDSLRLESTLRALPLQLNQQIKHNHFRRTPILNTAGIPISSLDEATGKERYFIAGATSGMWFPTGRNKILGPHPSLGFALGEWRGRWLIEFECDFRINRTPYDYYIVYNDTVRSTHQYLGYFVGLHAGYGIVNYKTTSIYMLGGLGLDGFDSVKGYRAKYQDFSNVEFNSLNLNAGIGFQHFPLKGGYLGIEALYNLTHYAATGAPPLSGNGITLRLTYGWIGNLNE